MESIPNFGLRPTKLVETLWITKKITHNDNGGGLNRNYGKNVNNFALKLEMPVQKSSLRKMKSARSLVTDKIIKHKYGGI